MANKSDAELVRDVTDELFWDPAVDNSALTVTADHGSITLGGTTSTYASKWEAASAAYRVLGVRSVINNIVVDPVGLDIRMDSDIAADVRNALLLDLAVPYSRIGVTVYDCCVTLTGDVDWSYQRDAAEADARRIRGLREVINEIHVRQSAVAPTEVSDSIRRAFARNAELYDDHITVSATEDGRVTLSGAVATWGERDLAEETAWRARGVTDVIDNIAVELI